MLGHPDSMLGSPVGRVTLTSRLSHPKAQKQKSFAQELSDFTEIL
jgi:hypothetical protein